jgi:hypothetical protein
MPEWVTDDQLYDAAERCARKLIQMYHDWIGDPRKHPRGPGNLPMTIIDSLRLDAEDFMFLDPQLLRDEYNRVLSVARQVGSNTDIAADIAETNAHLVNWTGDAATEFKRRVGVIDEYLDLQQDNIALGLQGLLMAFQLAIHARASYLELAEATIAAAEHEIGEESKRDAIAAVSIGQAVVESVLEFEPKKIVAQGASLLVKVGAEITKREIEGNDADFVIDSYQRVKKELAGSYDNGLNLAQRFLQDRLNEVVSAGQPFEAPLPVYCDVEGPNFNYEHFQSTRAGAPGPIAPTVAEERQKYVEEKRQKEQEESEIDRRLNHGGKGAI